MRRFCFFLLLSCSFLSCGRNPYFETNKLHKKQIKTYREVLESVPPYGKNRPPNFSEDWVGTTNFSLRRPNFVIIHHTAQDSVEQTLRTFTLPRTQVSSHYVIAEDGQIFQMLNDYYRAWHAGSGEWGGNSDLNSSSIGIELDNDGSEPFSEKQLNSLLFLLAELKEKYEIPTSNFIGHSDMAPSRKVDPSSFFPWERLADEGFGHWYDKEIFKEDSLAPFDKKEAEVFQPAFDPLLALRIIGYDIENPEHAIRAFELHFGETVNGDLDQRDLKILFNVYKKYL